MLADIQGAGIIRHIWLTTPYPGPGYKPGPNVLRDLVLRMYWDGEKSPSVEVPLGDFFACGHGANVPVESRVVTVAEGHGFNCWWPMPFTKSARIEVEHQGPDTSKILFYQIDYERTPRPDTKALRFHAQWRHENPTVRGRDYTILEASGRGHFVGTVLSIVPLEGHWWGEGEVKFYLDGDREWPTVSGTGTEDYFGSGWGVGEFSSAYFGAPLNRDGRVSLYRWHIEDPIRFTQDIRVTVQQIGLKSGTGFFERSDDVSSVAFWYQSEPHRPFAPLPPVEARRPRDPAAR